MISRIALWCILPALALLRGGCGGDQLLGKYFVVDMDRTLADIKELPAAFSQQMDLTEYRERIRKQYADQSLEFTSQAPRAFIIPVPLEGSVHGIFEGGWMRNQRDKGTILVYQWVSGSVYVLWGRGTFSKRGLAMTLDQQGSGAPVLYLRKGG